jgi:hypothetical protein
MRTKFALAAIITMVLVLPLFVSSVKAEQFAVAFDSPVQGQVVKSDKVELNVTLTNIGVLLTTVRSIPYTIYVDGQPYAQGDMGGNISNSGFSVTSDLVLNNITAGNHTVSVKITVLADSVMAAFFPDIGPIDTGGGTAAVNITVENPPTPTPSPPPQQPFSTIAITIGVIVAAVIITCVAVLLFHKTTKTKNRLQKEN